MGLSGLSDILKNSFVESFDFLTVPALPEQNIASFQMQMTPVTQVQLLVWRYATKKISSHLLPALSAPESADFRTLDDGIALNFDHPAENVSYEEATEFTQWLNAIESTQASGCRYDLPTEDEYLHALLWTFGREWNGTRDHYQYISYNDAMEHGVFYYKWPQTTASVSSKRPSPRGLRHMVGNVSIWTKTPVGPLQQITRGGGADRMISEVRRAFYNSGPRRLADGREYRSDNIGLRLVRSCR
jgi:formylglycine-generating enzyme required for sulfatase activity